MQTKVTVVYHSGDYDGEFCREIARHYFDQYRGAQPKPDVLTFVGWDYSDPKLDFPAEGQVYVLDLNPECFKEFPGIDQAQKRVIWIDHHKTAIDKWGTYLPGFRIDGVAACRLAWQWFISLPHDPQLTYFPQSKEAFVNRQVIEPLAVRLAGEYDIWDHRGDGDTEFQLGLRAQEEIHWPMLLEDGDPEKRAPADAYVRNIITTGRFIQSYVRKANALKMKNAFVMAFKGLKFLCLNGSSRGSLTFEALDKPETGHDALMLFYWSGKLWEFSLYHAKHRTDLDLSQIAAGYGGGGHRGAAGFRTERIPFPLFPQP